MHPVQRYEGVEHITVSHRKILSQGRSDVGLRSGFAELLEGKHYWSDEGQTGLGEYLCGGWITHPKIGESSV
jgi:hypothetical protein